METNAISTKKHITKYGVILGVAIFACNLFLNLTDNNMNFKEWTISIIGVVISLSIISYGLYNYKCANNGFLKLKRAFKIGMGIVLISAIIHIIWIVLNETIFEPDLANKMMTINRDRIIRNNPSITPEELHEQLAFFQKTNTIYFRIAFGLTGNILMGFIYVLISGLILAKKKDL
ncbi:DUF4199 domain-containing protein [Aquimarina sp. Aq78]|uniref:DUF4199 domain-containing protein n=1 Tax=Aquimarina sp. Aq78 TaxID=1191889 RepID=UPI000D0E5632|nr:DUF4199 domain-containing protein [Aquimarina sp. Aq78]